MILNVKGVAVNKIKTGYIAGNSERNHPQNTMGFEAHFVVLDQSEEIKVG